MCQEAVQRHCPTCQGPAEPGQIFLEVQMTIQLEAPVATGLERMPEPFLQLSIY